MRILYVGQLWNGGTCLQRMRALEDLGHDIMPVDTEPDGVRKIQKRIIYRIIRKLYGPLDIANANRIIIQSFKRENFDVLWLDKALTIMPGTLEHVRRENRKTIISGYSPDYMGAKHNQSKRFIKSLPFYHVFITTKSYGVIELEKLGVPKVFFLGNAYDPHTHKPMEISESEKVKFGGAVGFIGDYEVEREQFMYYLAQKGVPIRIWGPNWDRKHKLKHPKLKIEGRELMGNDYATAICSFSINLAFLRKINLDQQTTRSVEIPACGGFMLAERTKEHLELFEEGKEAEFFSSKEELLEKVLYYLNHEEERDRISRAGRERCMKSGYSNQERLKIIIQHLRGLMKRE